MLGTHILVHCHFGGTALMNWVLWFLGVPHNVVVLVPKREGACLMSMLQSTPLSISKEQSNQPHPLEVLWQVLRELIIEAQS